MHNPFLAGKPVTSENFADREEDIEELKNDILSGQNVIVFSPRRFGKTSLIIETLRRLGKTVEYAYLNLLEVTSFEEISVLILRQIYRRTDAVLDLIKKLSEGIIARVVGKELRIFGPPGELDNLFINVIDYLDRSASRRRVVIVFDEFQEIVNLKEDALKVIKAASERQRNVVYIFSGSEKSLLDIFQSSGSPLYKLGKIKMLDKPDFDSMVRFVRDKFVGSGFEIGDEEARFIVEVTDNIPYFTQLLAHEVWNLAKIRNRRSVDRNLIRDVLNKIIRENSAYYEDLLSRLPMSQRKALRIVLFEDEIYAHEVLRRYSISASTLQKAIKGLVDKRIIRRVGGRIEFLDPIFKEYLKSIWG